MRVGPYVWMQPSNRMTVCFIHIYCVRFCQLVASINTPNTKPHRIFIVHTLHVNTCKLLYVITAFYSLFLTWTFPWRAQQGVIVVAAVITGNYWSSLHVKDGVTKLYITDETQSSVHFTYNRACTTDKLKKYIFKNLLKKFSLVELNRNLFWHLLVTCIKEIKKKNCRKHFDL